MNPAKLPAVPEERMLLMCIGAIIFPTALFGYAWTDVDYVHTLGTPSHLPGFGWNGYPLTLPFRHQLYRLRLSTV